jgi:sulfur-oxidizing protein SoxY
MTANEYFKAIHILAEGNPLPNISSWYFSARSGRARVQSRVRLSNSQRVLAIAEMSDGSFHQGSANTLVTLSACTEV